MRFLIVAAVFAYAAAAPGLPVGQRLEPALPTVPAGDIRGAAIDAQVEVADHVVAAIDVDRAVHDKVTEIHGQVNNKVEEDAWRHVDAVKTVEAKLDGAVASSAPIIAKNFVRGVATPGVAYPEHAVYGAGPVVRPAGPTAPAVQASAPIVAPRVAPVVQPAAVADPIVQASAPAAYASAPVTYASAPATYASAPATYASVPAGYASAPATYASAPAGYTGPVTYAAAPAAYASIPAGYASAPAGYASAPAGYVSAPAGYASSPVSYAGPFGYASPYSGYSPFFDNNAYSYGFDQGFYGSPLSYANVF